MMHVVRTSMYVCYFIINVLGVRFIFVCATLRLIIKCILWWLIYGISRLNWLSIELPLVARSCGLRRCRYCQLRWASVILIFCLCNSRNAIHLVGRELSFFASIFALRQCVWSCEQHFVRAFAFIASIRRQTPGGKFEKKMERVAWTPSGRTRVRSLGFFRSAFALCGVVWRRVASSV